MKKIIPQKVANKVFNKMLSGQRSGFVGDWTERVLYKPETTKISNRFFQKQSYKIYI